MRLVHNPKFAEGMAASIRVGVEAAVGEQGYLFALGDMPQIAGATMLKVAETLKSSETIVVPVSNGRRGHPVAIGSAYRDALLALTGDRGARPVLAKNAANVVEVPVEDEGIFVDVDTQEAYSAALEAIPPAAPSAAPSPPGRVSPANPTTEV